MWRRWSAEGAETREGGSRDRGDGFTQRSQRAETSGGDEGRRQALNQLTSLIVAAAIRIHRALGPGLLENAYLACLCHELAVLRTPFDVQRPLPLLYDGVRVECAYRADLIVDNRVVVEVKALDTLAAVHMRQVRTYARLANCKVGLLLNFGAPMMKDGIKRVVVGFPTASALSARRGQARYASSASSLPSLHSLTSSASPCRVAARALSCRP